MITILAFRDREEALISKALLEAAGVPVTLKDEDGKLQLQVRDSNARVAQEVLVGTEALGWRRQTSGSPAGRGLKSRANKRVAACFCRGGATLLGVSILALLLLMPLSIRIPLTPFPLFFLFLIGGSGAVVRRFFRIRTRLLPRSKLR